MPGAGRHAGELGPPPRDVGFWLGLQLRFGGLFGIMGWSFYAGGILFSLLFFFVFEVDTQLRRWRGPRATAPGTLVRCERTHISDRHNQKRTYYNRFHPVYRMIFESPGPDGSRHRVSSRTNAPEELEDEAYEQLLYDRDDPSRGELLDALPGRPRITERGDFDASTTLGARLTLVPPLCALPATLLLVVWFLFA